MTWTDDKIGEVRKLWADGFSAQSIANQLGVTRNAVIGVAHRNGFPQRKMSRSPRAKRTRASPLVMKITKSVFNWLKKDGNE